MSKKLTKPQAYKLYCSIVDARGIFTNTDLRLYRSLSAKEAIKFSDYRVKTRMGGILTGARIFVTQHGYELALAHYKGTRLAGEIEQAWQRIQAERAELNPVQEEVQHGENS